jgi:hypothetical protein
MGNLAAIGLFPLEGSLFPYGFHNAIPNKLRPYFYYYPKTNVPLPFWGMDWGNYPIYPLGMKAIPNRLFTSINRQLYRAIIDSDFSAIEKISNSNFDLNREVIMIESGLTALGMATVLNNLEAIHYFIKRGVDLDYKIGPYGKTALHIAIENGHEMAAKLLLNNGANINAIDVFNHNVYDKIEFKGFYHFRPFLEHFKNNQKQIIRQNYDDYKYTREIILEDLDTITFKPSNLLEVSISNKISNINDNEKLSLDKFELYFFNQFDLTKLEKGNSNKLRLNYQSFHYFNNKELIEY